MALINMGGSTRNQIPRSRSSTGVVAVFCVLPLMGQTDKRQRITTALTEARGSSDVMVGVSEMTCLGVTFVPLRLFSALAFCS